MDYSQWINKIENISEAYTEILSDRAISVRKIERRLLKTLSVWQT